VGEHRVAHIDDLSGDRGLIVEIDGRQVGLFRVGDDVHAILNVCPHQGGPVGTGGLFPSTRVRAERGRLVEYLDHDAMVVCCPWHGWEFDVRTGVCTADSSRRVVRYPVEVRDGEVVVIMPAARAARSPAM
jgi:nitrite reductase (NADH) small subunit